MMEYAYNPSTREVEAGASKVQSLGYVVSKKQNKTHTHTHTQMTYIWKNVTGKYNVRENGYLTAL
jgi:hypothetical protein